jgi:hypothetical protein
MAWWIIVKMQGPLDITTLDTEFAHYLQKAHKCQTTSYDYNALECSILELSTRYKHVEVNETIEVVILLPRN